MSNQSTLSNYIKDIAPKIHSFWFSKEPFWFKIDQKFDNTIRDTFLKDYEYLKDKQLHLIEKTLFETLAIIIFFDQFPRNMFRDSARMFEGDSLAVRELMKSTTVHTLVDLSDNEKKFYIMPLMHSESIVHQEMCVEYCKEHRLDGTLKFALAHMTIIQQFGRFPHRNKVLGRTTTADESEFLKTHPGF